MNTTHAKTRTVSDFLGAARRTPPELRNEVKAILQQLSFSHSRPAYAKGQWLAASVRMVPHQLKDDTSGRGTRIFDAHLILLPLEEGWDWVQGVRIILVGVTTRGQPVQQITRTNQRGEVTFANIESGEYRLIHIEDVRNVTKQAVADLWKELRQENLTGTQEKANDLVTIRVERTVSSSKVATVNVFLCPYVRGVSLEGFPVFIRSRDQGRFVVESARAVSPGEYRAEFLVDGAATYDIEELSIFRRGIPNFPLMPSGQYQNRSSRPLASGPLGLSTSTRSSLKARLPVHASPGLECRLVYHPENDSYYLHVICQSATALATTEVEYIVRHVSGEVPEIEGELFCGKIELRNGKGEGFFLNSEEIQAFAKDYEIFAAVRDGV